MCSCGCGEVIELKPEHFNLGIPKYRLGHNTRVVPTRQRSEPLVSRPCGCGCGEMTTPGRQYRSGHNNIGRPVSVETRTAIGEKMEGARNHRFGKRPANYVGHYRQEDGYVMVHAPGHPFAPKTKPYVMQHRLNLEAHLRFVDPLAECLTDVDGVLYLSPDYEVHHVDGVKDNNEVSNLEVMTKSDHARHHALRRYS